MSNDLRTFSSRNVNDPDQRPKVVVEGLEIPKDSPLYALLEEMNTPEDPDFTPEQRLIHRRLRIEAAKSVAPFLRPKLAQVEVSGNMKLTHEDALRELE